MSLMDKVSCNILLCKVRGANYPFVKSQNGYHKLLKKVNQLIKCVGIFCIKK